MNIRKMTSEDLQRVLEIEQLSMSNPWSLHMFAYEVKNKFARCWVAEQEDQVIAFLVLWLIVDEAHIATIAVHPDFRRSGAGEKILTHALEDAAQAGAKTSLLEVRVSNTPALNLYRRLGYEEVGLRRGYYKDNGEDAILMTLHNIRRNL